MDWAQYYPAYAQELPKPGDILPVERDRDRKSPEETRNLLVPKRVEVADIGCGFGGLLFALSTLMPQTLHLGNGSAVTVNRDLVNCTVYA